MLVIMGAGGLAKELAAYWLDRGGEDDICMFDDVTGVTEHRFTNTNKIFGYYTETIRVYKSLNDLPLDEPGQDGLPARKTRYVIGVGNPAISRLLKDKAESIGLVPRDPVNFERLDGLFNVAMGLGTIICPGSILTTSITIGAHTMININCTVGHDTVIGDHCIINPNSTISGNVEIGDDCFIGTGAIILEKRKVAPGTIIGAASLVNKDITEPGTYVGIPARRIK